MTPTFRASKFHCPQHLGPWGDDPSCSRCTDDDGQTMPFRAWSSDVVLVNAQTGEIMDYDPGRQHAFTSAAPHAALSAQNPPDGSTHQTRFVVRWSRILGGLATGLLLVVMGVVAWHVGGETVSACFGLEPGRERATCGHSLSVIDTRRDGLPLCETEDSDDCRWRADIQGNGMGRSFNRVDGVTEYLD